MPPRGIKTEEKPVIYLQVSVAVCGDPDKTGVSSEQAEKLKEAFAAFDTPLIAYCPPLTAVDIATLYGLETQPEGQDWKDDYLFTDYYGRKVRFHKNVRNRPVHMSHVEGIEQDLLNGRFELNGETIIISRTGTVLDGQHTGIALWRAQQRLESEKDAETGELKWAAQWPSGSVLLHKIVVYGISESDQVVNTINTARPRTLSDVLYRSPYFASLPAANKPGMDRVTAARVTEHAIKHVWHRTGMYLDGFSPRRTHSEVFSWIEGHGGHKGRFLKCVRHVMDENRISEVKTKKGEEAEPVTDRITQFVNLGYAATAMWLMGCSSTSEGRVEKYYATRDLDGDTDKSLQWDYYDKSVEFWSDFGKTEGKLAALTKMLGELADTEDGGSRFLERDYVIALAWLRYREEEGVERKHLKIKYSEPGKNGYRSLLNHPTFGGIDLGTTKVKPKAPELDDAEAPVGNSELNGQTETPVTKEEVENSIKRLQEGAEPAKPKKPVNEVEVLEQLHAAHPDYDVILLQNSMKRWVAWNGDADKVGEVIGKKPSKHPTVSTYLAFKDGEEIETTTDKLTDAGLTVAYFHREDALGDWKFVMVYRPKKEVEGAGQRSKKGV